MNFDYWEGMRRRIEYAGAVYQREATAAKGSRWVQNWLVKSLNRTSRLVLEKRGVS